MTWTCWKPLLHEDQDGNETKYKTLRQVLLDDRIKYAKLGADSGVIEVKNNWDEVFEISFVRLVQNGEIFSHASKV